MAGADGDDVGGGTYAADKLQLKQLCVQLQMITTL